LIRKEIAGHLLSLRFSLALALFSAVTLTSVLAMYRQYEQRAEDYTLCQARAGEPRASIPPVLTSVLAWGLEDVTGRTVDLTQAPAVLTFPLQSPLSLLDGFFPILDLTYVVRVIGALVALGFAFDAVCGEGRGGTLALSLAAGASRGGILLGKLVGGSVVIAVLFLLPVLVGLSLLRVGFAAPLDAELVLRALLWAAASLLYLVCFYCLGLLVSALVATPKVALMGCLVLWTTLTFIVPGTLTSLLRLETGLQSPTRFEQVNFYTVRLAAKPREAVAEGQLQQREARAQAMLAFSHRALSALRLLPGPAYVEVGTTLAGTGIGQMPAYFGAVQRFLRGAQQGRQAGTSIPAFAFQRASLGACLQEAAAGILSLLIWTSTACWALTRAWARYDVRVKEAGPQ
jgi:ABC-type transport system involved in multi-copper enzyme maturation permease subunit